MSLRKIAKIKNRQTLRYCVMRMQSVSVVATFKTRQYVLKTDSPNLFFPAIRYSYTTGLLCALQVDKLNAELLSERARHEKMVQELRGRHEGEMNLTRQGYQEEMAKLQREMDQLKEGSVKVGCTIDHIDYVVYMIYGCTMCHRSGDTIKISSCNPLRQN